MAFFRSIAIICDANMKDFHWDTCISARSLLLWHDFSLCRIDFSLCRIDFRCVSKSTSICVEMTLYRNKRTLQIHPRLYAHTMQCTLGSIQHGRRMTRKNVIASYIIVVLSKKLLHFLRIKTGKNFEQINFDRQGWGCPWQTIFRFRYF